MDMHAYSWDTWIPRGCAVAEGQCAIYNLFVLYMKPPEIELQVLFVFKIVFALQLVKNVVGHCLFLYLLFLISWQKIV